MPKIACMEPKDLNEDRCLPFSGKVLVAFVSEQCPHCKLAKPEFQKLAQKSLRGITLAEAHANDFPEWPFPIPGVPFYALYENGKLRDDLPQPSARDAETLYRYVTTPALASPLRLLRNQ